MVAISRFAAMTLGAVLATNTGCTGMSEAVGSAESGITAATGCPTGFVEAIDVVDDDTNQLPDDCNYLYEAVFKKGPRVSFEWWGASGEHFGPAVFSLASHADRLRQIYAACGDRKPTMHIYGVPSEDQRFSLSIMPYSGLVALTRFGESPSQGADYLGYLAPASQGDDEIKWVNRPYDAHFAPDSHVRGERMRVCYEAPSRR